MTKKVLMICYYFPPIVTSGVARSLEFAKLLPHFGWTPSFSPSDVPRILGSRPDLGENPTGIPVERTFEWNLAGLADFLHGACRRIARLFGKTLNVNLFRTYLCFPDSQIAWFSTVAALRLAREGDLIYVSCHALQFCRERRHRQALDRAATGRRLP